MTEEKRLYYEKDVLEHKRRVARLMMGVAKELLDRAERHDDSKLNPAEACHYVEPVWALNHEDVEYGSPQYVELTGQMGQGLLHHYRNNDHHPEYYTRGMVCDDFDPVSCMSLIALLEMVCDWVAAAERKGNDPALALEQMQKKYDVSEQLANVIRNTLTKVVGLR